MDAMKNNLIKTEIRAKLSLRILPHYNQDNWYEKWIAQLDSATEGVMDILNKYNVEEKHGTG